MDGRDIGAKQSFVALPGYDGNRMPRHLASTARMSESISGVIFNASGPDYRFLPGPMLENAEIGRRGGPKLCPVMIVSVEAVVGQRIEGAI